jgi:hypothetical protein
VLFELRPVKAEHFARIHHEGAEDGESGVFGRGEHDRDSGKAASGFQTLRVDPGGA